MYPDNKKCAIYALLTKTKQRHVKEGKNVHLFYRMLFSKQYHLKHPTLSSCPNLTEEVEVQSRILNLIRVLISCIKRNMKQR